MMAKDVTPEEAKKVIKRVKPAAPINPVTEEEARRIVKKDNS